MFINFRSTPSEASNDNFQFAIGDHVDHEQGGWPSIVVHRHRPVKGNGKSGPDIYAVELVGGPNTGRAFLMLGEMLIPRSSVRSTPAVLSVA